MNTRLHGVKVIALAASIVIVFNLFINLGIHTFYPDKDYDDFCIMNQPTYTDQTSCEGANGKWSDYGYPSKSAPRPLPLMEQIDGPAGYCDMYFACNEEFQIHREFYSRNIFVVLMIVGFAALASGLIIKGSSAVSAGLVFAGLISFLTGTIRYWSAMHDYLRFIILGVALIALIWVGYKKLGDKRE